MIKAFLPCESYDRNIQGDNMSGDLCGFVTCGDLKFEIHWYQDG